MNQFLMVFISLYTLSLCIITINATVTYDEITVDLKGDIQYYLQKIGGDFTVGNLVRYGFHSCVTGCDGCFNVNNPSSAGLQPSFNALISLYTDPSLPSNITWSNKIANLADFWAISSTLANIIALPVGIKSPDFEFWVGRKSCPTSPNQTLNATFPNPEQGLEAQVDYFGTVFNLTKEEFIAIIGGHTLGFAHSTASGFDTLTWTATPTVLDNEFYYDIVNKIWYNQQAQVNKLYEWEGKDGFFMFNCDISIYKDLNSSINPTNGAVSCGYNSCAIRNDTTDQIMKYANNQTAWSNDYCAIWNKMMITKNDIDSLTRILPSN